MYGGGPHAHCSYRPKRRKQMPELNFDDACDMLASQVPPASEPDEEGELAAMEAFLSDTDDGITTMSPDEICAYLDQCLRVTS